MPYEQRYCDAKFDLGNFTLRKRHHRHSYMIAISVTKDASDQVQIWNAILVFIQYTKN